MSPTFRALGAATIYLALAAAAHLASLGLTLRTMRRVFDALPDACLTDRVTLNALGTVAREAAVLGLPMLLPLAYAVWIGRRTGRSAWAWLPPAAFGFAFLVAAATRVARDLGLSRLCAEGAFSLPGAQPGLPVWPELPAWMDLVEPLPMLAAFAVPLATAAVAMRLARIVAEPAR